MEANKGRKIKKGTKAKAKVEIFPAQTVKVSRGSRGIAPLILNP
jgi:hypothetical protein